MIISTVINYAEKTKVNLVITGGDDLSIFKHIMILFYINNLWVNGAKMMNQIDFY